MELRNEIITIKDINNREEVLNTLGEFYTDEDFCGNNGEDFTWEEAIDNGFESTQEYIIDQLEKNENLKGEELILQFFREWLDNDGYYSDWKFESQTEKDGSYVCSVAIVQGD
ncbi:MAG: hypothetical protein J6S67_06580 [Methanobrevibacter sp.]|nr:hypothetical protein [Methanobrevibacter sp.]